MKVKVIMLFTFIVFILSGCTSEGSQRGFTFEGESKKWLVTLNGELAQETNGIYEEANAIFTYIGENDIRSSVIKMDNNGDRAMVSKNTGELSNNDTVEMSFGNYRFWNLNEMGYDIFVIFEWREGEQNTKRKEEITLKLVE
ncbi:hypothetical protein CEY16_03255 [Halalkalibacillus sediminis]|uniref:Lipoprotein n=1 Tax=Halalkalibacillus sediminis TaxID=2018042 RepID=A0A2I0QWV0_9BACI|nr:hypothetical protein [Halalkalibacillus sediminis]PKR78785.1 hypothetical protein CEY16_03255 [Halalkalibacillus sediminis]